MVCVMGPRIVPAQGVATRTGCRVDRRNRPNGPLGGTTRAGTIPAMLETDQRAILPDAPQYNASLIRREDANPSLATFWVRFDGDPTPFTAGQYMTIGVFVEDAAMPTGQRIVQRPYSVASPPALA